jgi:cobalt-zinc-cadmium efflux system outer membrane protein
MRPFAGCCAVACASFAMCLCGCAVNRDDWPEAEPWSFAEATRRRPVVSSSKEGAIAQASHQTPAPATNELKHDLILTVEAVVAATLARNPSLDEMRAAASVAAARYPQVTSLDDPTFAFTTAPGSIGSRNTDYATRAEITQKVPFPGKRDLKGQISTAEAAAAARDVDDTRLALIASAKSAMADYYLAEKGTGVAQENAKLLREFRQNAESRYKTGQSPQQDLLQADVEVARQEERLVALRRARQVASARLNTLMHMPPDSPLPPPAEIRESSAIPEPAVLRASAQARPDLKAVLDRLAAEEASLSLALKEYKPDVDLMAAYDGFWQGEGGRPLQWQIGARVNLPVRYTRRSGAVNEAQSRVAQRRAEVAKLTDRVNFEVQEAWEQVRETDEIVKLYEAKILPAAEANVKEAQSGYVAGRVPFLNLVEAQRNRVALKDRYFEAVAESLRRRAALEKSVGQPLPAIKP